MKGDVKEAHDEYLKELKAAGYKILFEEVEAPNDSEVSWQGEGRTGQVALRNDAAAARSTCTSRTARPSRPASRDSPVEGSRLASFLPISPP